MKARQALFLSLTITTGCLGQRGPSDGNYSNAIIGGSVERGYPGVGALLEDGDIFCTATLVSSTVAVTAAHCLDGVRASDLSFFMGADTDDQDAGESIRVASIHPYSSYDAENFENDIGVVVLEDPADADVIPFLRDEMDEEDWVGREPLFVGYGYAPESGYGVKRSVKIPITFIYDDAFEYEGDDINTCSGDSGGPALYKVDGQMTLIGVTSFGDEDCEIYGVDARVDPFADFIDSFIDTQDDAQDTSGTDDDDTTDSSGGSDDDLDTPPGADVHGYADLSPEGRSILYLANDLDLAELDDDVGLDSRAAANIIAYRAGTDGILNSSDDAYFGSLAELDEIGYVARTALASLVDYASGTGILQGLMVTHSVEEYSDEAAAVLALANSLTEAQLDDDVPLDSRAAANIVAYRAGQEDGIRFLHELDLIGYVGATAFENLSAHAEAQGLF